MPCAHSLKLVLFTKVYGCGLFAKALRKRRDIVRSAFSVR
ncbi:hypothetical protein HMPREF1248_1389 [Coriobacteriaceae bacterium BV3Ac1]|nr:hypothetical protein HMPREF1248_1389 [Coriobacteriaceae bacterium BV3Ac1]